MREYAKMVKNTFNYTGRARRREYWVPSVMNVAINYFLFSIVFFVATMAGDCLWFSYMGSVSYTTANSVAATIASIPYTLFSVFAFITGLSLGVRRFHDAGFKAWVYALCYVGTCCCLIGAIAMLVIGCFDSKDANEWGENPKLANPDEYSGATSIVVSVVLLVVSIVLLLAAMFANMALDPSVFTL